MKTKLTKQIAIVIALLFGFFPVLKANNVNITGTSVAGSNITFNISWDNSWNTNLAPNNWDAVWVFVKYEDCATRLWTHAGLSTVGADHTAGSPLQVDPVTDGKGVFIRRSALGGGNIASTSVTLKMTIPAGTYNYKVFGVEMVNVPQGAFDIGDGAAVSTYSSVNITAAIQGSGISGAALGGSSSAVPAAFPMGYNSFYCMKYEISEEQYVEFLNTLTYDQQVAHTAVDPILAAGTLALGSRSYRNGIVIATPGSNSALPAVYACDQTTGTVNFTNDAQNTACGYLTWGDVTAYLDWSALRPMTEMEFEKACRGPVGRLANEYPWGSTTILAVTTASITNPYTTSESSSVVTNGQCHYYSGTGAYLQGPMRCGMLASGSSGRATAGATYYGIMEMGGNLLEMTVTTGNATGVLFTGALGDGTLPSNGNANVANWPSITGVGAGNRGGSFRFNTTPYIETSNRSVAASVTYNLTRYQDNGGRGVR